MCDLTEQIEDKEVHGYKIVAEKDGKDYSPAFGICYNDYEGKRMPENPEQKRITMNFNPYILYASLYGYREEMVGRTAIFVSFSDAMKFYVGIIVDPEIRLAFKLKIKEAIVSDGLMSGYYLDADCLVIAGRKIKIGKEVYPQIPHPNCRCMLTD